MKHYLERTEISPSCLQFSWVGLSSEKWVMIYKVSKTVLYNILCYPLQDQEEGIPPVYNDGVMSIW